MTDLSAADLETVLTTLGKLLQDKNLYYQVVAIGGGGRIIR